MTVATVFQFDCCQPLCARRMGGLGDVSISITSAVVYGVFGAIFFLLIFLLVLLGVTDCNWDCNRY